ncbi:MAG: BamA/TamA family outer membrane protein [Lentimicrobium sp.]|nr:BamA/TamA family outer membrane protein [Lentimicrobium sp.]
MMLLFGSFIPMAQENYEVRKVKFKGNKTLDDDFLLDRMALKEVSWVQKLLTKKEPYLYHREMIEMDMERLTRIYQTEGFLEAEATMLPPDINDKKKKVKLTIEVDEGEPIRVDSVYFRLTDTVKSPINMDSLTRKVFKRVALTKGKRFRDEDLQSDQQALGNAFRNMGYAYVDVTYDLNLRPDDYKTDIIYFIKPGPLCYVGTTHIVGAKHVKDSFIRKQLKYEAGEVYDRSALEKTRINLYHLQLFRIVSVLPQTNADSTQNPIPVRIYLEETPRLNGKLGLGYGTEDKFRTFLDLNYLGFLGGARRINLQLKHSAILPYSASLRWIQPRFIGDRSTIELNPYIMRNKEPGYDNRTLGLRVPMNHQFNNWLTSSLTYYFEAVEQAIEADDPEFAHIQGDKFPYNKSGVILGSVYDNSKPRFSATSGINLSLAFKVNGYLFGGDFSYTRLWGTFRIYHKIGDFTLAFKMAAGGIHSSDTSGFIPVEDRFYSGGSISVRGWRRAQLGPKRESGTPLGGKSLLESSFEVRFPLFWRLSAVGFIDAGNVWTGSYSYNINDLGYAVGPGLRIETPIGPVRFDVGFPVWNEKKLPQFFISVGQAF